MVLAGAALLSAVGLNLDRLLAARGAAAAWTAAHRPLAAGLFVLGYTATMALGLPGAALLSLLAGFLFGRLLGVPLVLVAGTGGAALAFLLVRGAAGGWLRRRGGDLPPALAANLRANGFGYVLVLRLFPLAPFALVNLAAALFEVPFSRFLLATALGIVPATVIYVSLGRELGRVADPAALLSPAVALALAGLALLALVPLLLRRGWVRRNGAATGARRISEPVRPPPAPAENPPAPH